MPTSGGEGEWPTVDELKKVLDVSGDDFDHQLDRHLAAAIEQVKLDVGAWDEMEDEPSFSLAQAALLLAVRIAKSPAEAPPDLRADTAYQRLLKGNRVRFGIG